MATADHDPSTQPTSEGSSVFDEAFSEQFRQELLEEDRLAGASVCGLLIFIFAVGLLLAIVAVNLAS